MAKSLWLMRSWHYIDRDPEIDRFQTLWRKERLKEPDLAMLSGLSESTVKNISSRPAKRDGRPIPRFRKWRTRWATNTIWSKMPPRISKARFQMPARNTNNTGHNAPRKNRRNLAKETDIKDDPNRAKEPLVEEATQAADRTAIGGKVGYRNGPPHSPAAG